MTDTTVIQRKLLRILSMDSIVNRVAFHSTKVHTEEQLQKDQL
jgi:hypothetical protein